MVLEARSLKPRCGQGWFLPGVLRENPSHISHLSSVTASSPWLVDASPQSAFFMFLLLHVSSFLSVISSLVIGFRTSLVFVSQSFPTLCDPWTITFQAPLSMGLPRQEYWSGLPSPSPGIRLRSPAFKVHQFNLGVY